MHRARSCPRRSVFRSSGGRGRRSGGVATTCRCPRVRRPRGPRRREPPPTDPSVLEPHRSPSGRSSPTHCTGRLARASCRSPGSQSARRITWPKSAARGRRSVSHPPANATSSNTGAAIATTTTGTTPIGSGGIASIGSSSGIVSRAAASARTPPETYATRRARAGGRRPRSTRTARGTAAGGAAPWTTVGRRHRASRDPLCVP
jgi:hypothetical protein